jgi:hypothetical protein
MQFVYYSCQILIKLEFSRKILKKYSNTEFHGNLSCGSRNVPCGQTDGQKDRRDEANIYFSQFFERS